MKITRIKINKVNDDVVKCNCEITLDNCFIIKGIKMIHKYDKVIIQMPYTTYTVKDSDGREIKKHMDVAHPIDEKTRNMFNECIFNAYNKTNDKEYIEYLN